MKARLHSWTRLRGAFDHLREVSVFDGESARLKYFIQVLFCCDQKIPERTLALLVTLRESDDCSLFSCAFHAAQRVEMETPDQNRASARFDIAAWLKGMSSTPPSNYPSSQASGKIPFSSRQSSGRIPISSRQSSGRIPIFSRQPSEISSVSPELTPSGIMMRSRQASGRLFPRESSESTRILSTQASGRFALAGSLTIETPRTDDGDRPVAEAEVATEGELRL